ncbi:MAG: O-acetyltransferase OatA [Alphaproteobacteria bacterium ADurb.BinA280]|jgi:peptidoglycan/LPS O-acetylase OafA/YrhL|nr:acyltransferase [Aquimonas sp.]OPZ12623.1 MAG: O-acetyltransferase OatA [Alphaproteobacteria bacterium ADurb.BinA280]
MIEQQTSASATTGPLDVFRPARHFVGIDVLRIAAALGVLLFHLHGAGGWPDFAWELPTFLLQGAWVGVDVFFVISGAVVGQAALRLWRSAKPSRYAFLRSRWWRIAPLYLLTSIVYVAFFHESLLVGADWLLQVSVHVLFIHNWFPSTIFSINPPTWSLASEMQLYVLLALSAPIIVRASPMRVALGVLMVAMGWRSLSLIACHHFDASNLASCAQHFAYLTPGMLDSFGLGLALILLREQRAFGNPKPSTSDALNLDWKRVVVLLGGSALCLGTGAFVFRDVVAGTIWESPVWAVSFRSLIALGAALVVWALLDLRLGVRASQRARHWGNLSYGIYLWHWIVILAWLAVTDIRGLPMLCSVVFLTWLLSELTWRAFERPLQRWRSGRSTN